MLQPCLGAAGAQDARWNPPFPCISPYQHNPARCPWYFPLTHLRRLLLPVHSSAALSHSRYLPSLIKGQFQEPYYKKKKKKLLNISEYGFGVFFFPLYGLFNAFSGFATLLREIAPAPSPPRSTFLYQTQTCRRLQQLWQLVAIAGNCFLCRLAARKRGGKCTLRSDCH